MSFEKHIAQDLRLVVLRTLAEQGDYTLNEAVLQTLAGTLGHNVSRLAMRATLRWLEEVEAVTVSEVATVLVAKLTERGLDHVEGRTAIDGVNRPSPKG